MQTDKRVQKNAKVQDMYCTENKCKVQKSLYLFLCRENTLMCKMQMKGK